MKEKKSEWARLAKSDTQDIDWRTWLYSLAKICSKYPGPFLSKRKNTFLKSFWPSVYMSMEQAVFQGFLSLPDNFVNAQVTHLPMLRLNMAPR